VQREVVALDTLAKAQVKVPQVLDGNTDQFADPETVLYFVMEYIRGRSLKEEVAGRGPLPLDQAARIVRDLCNTVSAAHENDVLHRDLKPDNIIVRDFDRADLVIVDYGLSYLEEDGAHDLTHTNEQFRNRFLSLPETNTLGGDHRDKRSDATAVAAVLYYCLTGFEPGHLRDGNNQPPHRRPGFSVREAIRQDDRCERVERLLDRAFTVEVENRFQSCEEFLLRLEAALSPTAVHEDPAIIAADLAKLMRQHDRPTLLAEYGQIAQQVLEKLQQEFTKVGQPIKAPFLASIAVVIPNHDKAVLEGIDPLSGGSFSFTVGLQPHNRSRTVAFMAGAKGSECVILRWVVYKAAAGGSAAVPTPAGPPYQVTYKGEAMGGGTAPQPVIARWEPVLFFQPEFPPSEEALRSLARESASNAIRDLGREVLPR
jgi:serine/threonine protein kinase